MTEDYVAVSENRRVIYRLLFNPLPLATAPTAVNLQLLARAYRLIGSMGYLATVVVRIRCHDYARAGCPLDMVEYAAARDLWNAVYGV